MNDIVPNGIRFRTVGSTLILSLTKKSLIENMQKDCSAFEAWAICFKAKYPSVINSVRITWTPLNEGRLKPCELGHYYRSLYRLYKFSKNFPNWAEISPMVPSSFIDEMDSWVLNYPTKGCSESNKEKANAEAKLEREIVHIFQNSFEIADEQFPVGLFSKSVAKVNSRSPRGLSQIDLWSLSEDILSIYELKNDENVAAGIITELLLYTNVMSDFVSHTFNYPDSFLRKKKFYRHSKELYDRIQSGTIKEIEGIMLANRIHPLITSDVIALLNTNKNKVRYAWRTVSSI